MLQKCDRPMSLGCNKKIIKWRSPGTSPDPIPSPPELRMNPSARIAALAFAIALTVAACKPAGENNAQAPAAGAPAAPSGIRRLRRV